MPITLDLNELIEYTDWQRGKWQAWFQRHGDRVLDLGAGPQGDGRFESVGDLMRHIFAAEKRYVERLSSLPLTDTAALPKHSVEALFQLGQQTRRELRDFIETFPPNDWNVPQHYQILSYSITATPRKIVTHILMHEIRHWAQIGTLLRLNGLTGEFHDFLFSPAMDTASGPEQESLPRP